MLRMVLVYKELFQFIAVCFLSAPYEHPMSTRGTLAFIAIFLFVDSGYTRAILEEGSEKTIVHRNYYKIRVWCACKKRICLDEAYPLCICIL